MRCPYCGHIEDKVVDSREAREGDSIRRRRECQSCRKRFTSYERVEEIPILIVKKDGRRQPFDPNKLLKGMMAACQKRPVRLSSLEELVNDIHTQIAEIPDREIRSLDLGEMAMDGLKAIDSVAYVRFASVYREFKDLSEFAKSIEALVGTAKTVTKSPTAYEAPASQSANPARQKKATVQKIEPQTPLFQADS